MRDAGLSIAGNKVLNELNVTLHAGECMGIAGSNGAGKSSLLRLACAQQASSTGSVYFQGTDLSQIAPRHRATRMAVLPQSTELQFDFTVRQVITLGRSPHGDVNSGGRHVVEHVIDSCQLSSFADRHYQSLSGGEKQRTQIARVLAQLLPNTSQHSLDGQMLLLDEPTSALDIRHQELILALITELKSRGCALIVVMHDINLLSRCADQLLLLKSGSVFSKGPTNLQMDAKILSGLFDFPLKIQNTSDMNQRFVYPDTHAQLR